jgi:hypothetical protein
MEIEAGSDAPLVGFADWSPNGGGGAEVTIEPENVRVWQLPTPLTWTVVGALVSGVIWSAWRGHRYGPPLPYTLGKLWHKSPQISPTGAADGDPGAPGVRTCHPREPSKRSSHRSLTRVAGCAVDILVMLWSTYAGFLGGGVGLVREHFGMRVRAMTRWSSWPWVVGWWTWLDSRVNVAWWAGGKTLRCGCVRVWADTRVHCRCCRRLPRF